MFNAKSCTTTSLVYPTLLEETEEKHNGSNEEEEEDIDPEDKSISNYIQANENELSMDNAEDNLGNLLLFSIDPNIHLEYDDDIGNNNQDENENDQYIDTIQTTNVGKLASDVDHETKYGGAFGNIKISGSVILNQCGTLSTHKETPDKGKYSSSLVSTKMVATHHG
eukprot:11890901-Ditylum_brightwellii.AAC.1